MKSRNAHNTHGSVPHHALRSSGGTRINYSRVAIAVALLMSSVAMSQAASLTLTPDLGRSGTPFPFSSVAGTLNDSFAYNPLAPTAPLPVQAFEDSFNSFHGNSGDPAIAYTLDGTYQDLFIDLYGRDSSIERDNDITIQFYSGSWLARDLTQEIIGFTIADAPPFYGRVTAAPGTQADRFLVTSPTQNFFTIMETRANGIAVPEPSAGLLIAGGATLLGLMRRTRQRDA